MHASLQFWITHTFGSRANLDDAMGWTRHTTDRWYKRDPRRFLMYASELSDRVDVDALQWMVDQRLLEIEHEQSSVVADSE